jgi:hypothetical protein
MKKWIPKRGEEVEYFNDKEDWYKGIFVCYCDKYAVIIKKYSIEYFDNLTDYDRITEMTLYSLIRKIKTKEEKYIERLEGKLKESQRKRKEDLYTAFFEGQDGRYLDFESFYKNNFKDYNQAE